MKKLFLLSFALFFAACAHQQPQLAHSHAPLNAEPEQAANWCFEAFLNGDGEGFYDACMLKRLKGQAAEVHRLRWLRTCKEASLKAEQGGGLSQVSSKCQTAGIQANCEITYDLAFGKRAKAKMPMVRDGKTNNWQVLY